MELILNGVNGRYLRNILENCLEFVERVDAAVAYASEEDLLFSWCLGNKIPLTFWGRFDEGVPIKVAILEKFLKIKSPNFVCRLVRSFHPKIIWWRGYGAYIGSSNLTQSAWWANFEGGVFFTEEELSNFGYDIELNHFFSFINSKSSPLTDELFNLIKLRDKEKDKLYKLDRGAADSFVNTNFVQSWGGLASVSIKSANTKRMDAFLKEWNETLQILRDIAARISTDENRPSWVTDSAPSGSQADQFLQAHYYLRTFDGRKANYEFCFHQNKANPEKALSEAISWWKGLPQSPLEVDTMLNDWAPFLRKMLAADQLMSLDEDEIVEIFGKIHATIDYSRRVSNKSVGLEVGKNYSIPEKVNALARTICKNKNNGKISLLSTWYYVLYEGNSDDLPLRFWKALSDSSIKIDNFGVSAMGEMVGWARPDKFPPRNGRTSKALRSLGYNVAVHV